MRAAQDVLHANFAPLKYLRTTPSALDDVRFPKARSLKLTTRTTTTFRYSLSRSLPVEMASASDHAVPDQGPRLLAICIVLPTLAYVIFATRVAWRWKSRQWGLDDVMITCAAVGSGAAFSSYASAANISQGMLAIQTAFCVKCKRS